VASSKGVFVLVGDQIRKVPLSELSRTAAGPKELPKTVAIPKELPKTAVVSGFFTKYEQVPNLSVKSIFKFNEDKLLVVSKENTLVLLDMATLKWQPITNDLKKVAITAAVNSGDNLFLGMESGDVIICKNLKLGNVISIQKELTITAHKTRITSLAYDASSNKLFSASLDQTANIFDLNLKKVRNDYVSNYFYKIEGFDKWIWDFALVQTGKVNTLLTVDESGELKSWQTDAVILYNEIYAAINKK
jgi:WD40 repeat protein